MKIVTGIISLNENNRPEGEAYNSQYIKVRVPAFHGPKYKEDYNTNGINSGHWVSDDMLPWAKVLIPVSEADYFIAADHFMEDEIVLVQLINEDPNNLIITGKLSNFAATNDPEVAAANASGNSDMNGLNFNSFSGGAGLISTALNEVGVSDDGHDKVKYNKEYWGNRSSYAGLAWCCAFVWWCFKHSGLSKYFYDGNKTAKCQTLLDFHRKKGEFIKNNFKAGDIIFFNWNGGTTAQHVGIAISDQSGSNVETVEGNTSDSNQANGGSVMRKKRNMSCIIGGYRPGKSSSNEQICYDYFTNTMHLSAAAACGIMGNIYYESSFKNGTEVVDSNGKKSAGICQWNGGRRTNLINYAKSHGWNYLDLMPQLNFLNQELNGYSSMMTRINAVSNSGDGAYKAAGIWEKEFERPKNLHPDKRGGQARKYFNQFS